MSNVEEAREDLKEERKQFYILNLNVKLLYRYLRKLIKKRNKR